MKGDHIDDVLDRFQHHNRAAEDILTQRKSILSREFDADVENDPIELESVRERQQLLWFGLTPDQKQELNIAFRVVSGGKETIPGSKVFDLFQAIRLTLLPSQIKTILSNCLKDRNGQYSYPSLETEINKFVANMISIRVLRGLFEFLKQSGALPATIDDIENEKMARMQRITALRLKDADKHRRFSRRYMMTDLVTNLLSFDARPQSKEFDAVEGVKWEEFSHFLNGVMQTMNEEDQLTKADVTDVIGEISTRRNDCVNFFDFINLFRA